MKLYIEQPFVHDIMITKVINPKTGAPLRIVSILDFAKCCAGPFTTDFVSILPDKILIPASANCKYVNVYGVKSKSDEHFY